MVVGSVLELDDCFLERFGSDLGAILGVPGVDFGVVFGSWPGDGDKIMLRSIFDRFLADFGPNLGPKLGPSWAQVGAKLTSKSISKSYDFLLVLLIGFSHLLGSILEGFGGPSWVQYEGQER